MYRRGINKYIKQNWALSWTYLRDYTGMRSQQNIKELNINLSATGIADRHSCTHNGPKSGDEMAVVPRPIACHTQTLSADG